MATTYLYSSLYKTDSSNIRPRKALAAASTCEGDHCTWVIETAGHHVTLAKWQPTRHGEYVNPNNPCIVVKNTTDSSSTNTLVKSEDGTTIFTFDTNDSAAPVYAAFRLVSGDKNTASWEVA